MIDWNGTVPPDEPADYVLHYKNVDHGRFYIGIFATVFVMQAGLLVGYLGFMEKLTSVSFDWWFVVRCIYIYLSFFFSFFFFFLFSFFSFFLLFFLLC